MENKTENEITRDDFMSFFRDTDKLNTLSADDREEVFFSILLGSSDFTKELFDELFCNYDIGHLEVIEVI